MANYYHEQWLKARLTEGASQRVQEDTLKFARIMEGLGTGLLDSIMTLIAFTPILWGLSKQIDVLPWIGKVDHALVWVAIISALGGTLLLAAVGIKLPGIEYDIQKEELVIEKNLYTVKMIQLELLHQLLVNYIIELEEFIINLISIIYILTLLNGVIFKEWLLFHT